MDRKELCSLHKQQFVWSLGLERLLNCVLMVLRLCFQGFWGFFFLPHLGVLSQNSGTAWLCSSRGVLWVIAGCTITVFEKSLFLLIATSQLWKALNKLFACVADKATKYGKTSTHTQPNWWHTIHLMARTTWRLNSFKCTQTQPSHPVCKVVNEWKGV